MATEGASASTVSLAVTDDPADRISSAFSIATLVIVDDEGISEDLGVRATREEVAVTASTPLRTDAADRAQLRGGRGVAVTVEVTRVLLGAGGPVVDRRERVMRR